MTKPRVSFVRTRTVITWLRPVTGFGEKTTCETVSRWFDGTLAAGIEISPLGRRIAPDGSGSVTTADSVEMTVVDPSELRAVTLKRSLRPMSSEATR